MIAAMTELAGNLWVFAGLGFLLWISLEIAVPKLLPPSIIDENGDDR